MKRIQDSLHQIALVIFLESLNTIHRRRFNSSDQQSIELCETWRNLYYYNCSCIYYWHYTGLVNLIYTTFSWELNSVGYCEAVLIRRTLTLTWRGPSSTPYLWGNKSKLRKDLILRFHLYHCTGRFEIFRDFWDVQENLPPRSNWKQNMQTKHAE